MDLPVLIMDTTEQLPDPSGGLRRGIATLQVSMLFMGRTDAPAHLGSFSRASALLQRLWMQGRWQVMGCVANEQHMELWSHISPACLPAMAKTCCSSLIYLSLLQTTERRLHPWLNSDITVYLQINKNWSRDSQPVRGHLQIELDNLLGAIFYE